MSRQENLQNVQISWRRYLFAVLLDFWIYSACYSLFVSDWLPGPKIWIRSFLVLELVFFGVSRWVLSPGMVLLGIRRREGESFHAAGKTRRTLARAVDSVIYQRESWMTLSLAFLFFSNGIQSFVAGFDRSLVLPVFGVFPPPGPYLAYFSALGLAGVLTGFAYFRLHPSAFYLGTVLLLVSLVSFLVGHTQWRQLLDGLLSTAGDVFLPAIPIGMTLILLAAMLASKKKLINDGTLLERQGSGAVYLSVLLAVFLLGVAVKFAVGGRDETEFDTALRETVADGGGLMAPEQKNFVARYHAMLRREHDIDYRVLTVAGPVDIGPYSAAEFAERSVGSYSRKGRGLLLVLDKAGDRVRLEVSANLEGVYTDAFVSYLERRQMVYFFNSGRVADGILAATEMIFTRAQEAEAGMAFDPGAEPGFSTGGGAQTAAMLDRRDRTALPDFRGRRDTTSAGPKPIDTVNAYLESLRRRDANPDKEIFTPETRAMMRRWTVTPAQMDNELKAYRNCPAYEQKIKGSYAVILYRDDGGRCSPRFLRNDGGLWRLDLVAMQKSIVFNHKNQWRLRQGADPDYLFAFAE
ncbi:MAG: TPM domain-containing protein [Gammaproteobacteria bacterium]